MSSTHVERRFEAHGPLSLYVENGAGTVHVTAHDTTEATVSVSGRDAEDVSITFEDGHLAVVAPNRRTGFFQGSTALDMTLTVPTASEMFVKTGAADITVVGSAGAAQLKSGSGEVSVAELGGPGQIETGSGDVAVDLARGELRVKSGSGDVQVDRSESAVAVSTGSGDVRLGTSGGPAVVKTGSGDLRVLEAVDDITLSTGSGDLRIDTARRGRFSLKAASGDLQVGIPAGIPVWTDISTISGEIHSDLDGAGHPEEGADHIEVRAKTVSGDVILNQL